MGSKTDIEWTDATWNPLRGCTRVSEGCRFCYAERVAARFSGPGLPYEGLATRVRGDPRWTNIIKFVDGALELPLRWKTPQRIFVNSMSDLFHESVPDRWIHRIFTIMAIAKEHTFQVLTKRPARMLDFFSKSSNFTWPLPNVWLGVSVENQATADERIPLLLETPAAKRFLSCEPLLGPINLDRLYSETRFPEGGLEQRWDSCISGKKFSVWADGDVDGMPRIDWVIVGGESGRAARPMHLDWARALRDQCRESEVPFFFKQWGEWLPAEQLGWYFLNDDWLDSRAYREDAWHVGKKIAGALLDGVEHKAFPENG